MFNFYWLLNCPIWPVRLRMFVIGQVKLDINEQPIIFEHFVIDTIITIIVVNVFIIVITNPS